MTYTWSRYPDLFKQGYEVSSAGDKRFSALYARIGEQTIEEIYQLDIKGFRRLSDDWRTGKGQKSLRGQTKELLWEQYLDLWRRWAAEHPRFMGELRAAAALRGFHLTDQFATTQINQAHSLSVILTETPVGDYHQTMNRIRKGSR